MRFQSCGGGYGGCRACAYRPGTFLRFAISQTLEKGGIGRNKIKKSLLLKDSFLHSLSTIILSKGWLLIV